MLKVRLIGAIAIGLAALPVAVYSQEPSAKNQPAVNLTSLVDTVPEKIRPESASDRVGVDTLNDWLDEHTAELRLKIKCKLHVSGFRDPKTRLYSGAVWCMATTAAGRPTIDDMMSPGISDVWPKEQTIGWRITAFRGFERFKADEMKELSRLDKKIVTVSGTYLKCGAPEGVLNVAFDDVVISDGENQIELRGRTRDIDDE